MNFLARALYVRYSPFKLRSIVDVIRGKNVQAALNWLSTCHMNRVAPIKKVVESAAANAKHLKQIRTSDLLIKDIRVDHGPKYKYFKPGAMGRASVQTRGSSHMTVELQLIEEKV
jgi:large subunit ribosomal protein L22